MGCSRVANNVREGLLKNPEKRGVHILRQGEFANVCMNIAPDAGAVLKFVGLPFQCGGEAEMVKNPGSKFGGDATHQLDGGVNVRC
jgi:hypothetical protein